MNLIKKIFLILIIITPLSFINCKNKSFNENELLLYTSYDLLQKNHFTKRKKDRVFFQKVFDLYLNIIDPEKDLFLKQEVKDLFEMSYPQEDLNSLLKLPKKTHEIITQRQKKLALFSKKMLSQPVNLETNRAYMIPDNKEKKYTTSEKELSRRWGDNIRYTLINEIAIALYPNNKPLAAKKNIEKADIEKIKKQKKEKLLKRQKKLLKILDKANFLHTYIKALALSYDKHSNYFLPIEKENFDLHMRGSFEGIGASLLKKENGFIEIIQITPGGPSYRQKELEVGDVILKIGQKKGKFLEIQDISLNKAITLIRGKKGTTVHLNVKKENGVIKTISIVRDQVILEEGFAKSAIINKNNKKIGYLLLPSFYKDFTKQTKHSSSDDVRNELNYFNNQKVDALIFDLRGNSGGYLQEAVKIAGLFFKSGPVVIVKSANKTEIPLLDVDETTVFDKPVVVFIDYYSASAAEIVAAALQDYGRAIVIGSRQSYGKGTVQTITSLSDHYGGNAKKFKLGSMKLTIQKFYRITGISTQLLGVSSNIELPSPITPRKDKKNLFGVIKNDNIDPIVYQRWKKHIYHLPKLQKLSRKRLEKNIRFINIKNRKRISEDHSAKNTFKLSLSKAIKERKEFLSELKNYPIDSDQELNFKIDPKPFAKQQQLESGFKEKSIIYKEWIKKLEKDFYLEEATNILDDILLKLAG